MLHSRSAPKRSIQLVAVVDFESGSAVYSIFHDFAFPGVGAFEGLTNQVAGSLTESSVGASGNRVQIFYGVGFQPRTENPFDPGLDGIVGGGDAQIRIRFRAMGFGPAQIRIGRPRRATIVAYFGKPSAANLRAR